MRLASLVSENDQISQYTRTGEASRYAWAFSCLCVGAWSYRRSSRLCVPRNFFVRHPGTWVYYALIMKFTVICFLCLFLFSCAKSTYIYETQKESPELLKNEQDFLFFENDTLKIVYTFWENRGVLAFSIYNKLQQPLYVNWKRSSFIINSKKLDYWQEEYITERVTKGKQSGSSVAVSSPIGYLMGLSGSSSTYVTNESTIIPERVTFIAPQSFIYKSKFNLIPIEKVNIKKRWETGTIPRLNKKPVKGQYVTFDKNNTPINFRNFFTISTSEDFSTESYISHEFYVTRITKLKSIHTYKTNYDHDKKTWFRVYYFYNPSNFFVE